MSVLDWLSPILSIFKRAWDEDAFTSKFNPRKDAEDQHQKKPSGEGDRPRVDPAAVTAALHAEWFAPYVEMLSLLQRSIEYIGFFASSCTCHCNFMKGLDTPAMAHQHDRKSLTQRQREHRFQICAGERTDVHKHCPCSGMRAPEFAADCMEDVYATMQSDGVDELNVIMGKFDIGEASRKLLLEEWYQVMTHIHGYLRLKFAFWRTLPWLLCGVAHHQVEKAILCAISAIQMFDAVDDVTKHHRLSLAILAPGSVCRQQMESFIEDGDVKNYNRKSAGGRWKLMTMMVLIMMVMMMMMMAMRWKSLR